MLHPDFPVLENKYQMTKKWSINLPDKFNRRIEEGSLVIWKKGITMWINVWNNDKNLSPKDQLFHIKKNISKDAYDIKEKGDSKKHKLIYRLDENKAFGSYGFIAGKSGYVQIAIYYDADKDSNVADKIFGSIEEN